MRKMTGHDKGAGPNALLSPGCTEWKREEKVGPLDARH